VKRSATHVHTFLSLGPHGGLRRDRNWMVCAYLKITAARGRGALNSNNFANPHAQGSNSIHPLRLTVGCFFYSELWVRGLVGCCCCRLVNVSCCCP
jgi:hypothetical protein